MGSKNIDIMENEDFSDAGRELNNMDEVNENG